MGTVHLPALPHGAIRLLEGTHGLTLSPSCPQLSSWPMPVPGVIRRGGLGPPEGTWN